jgi:hypothetical protein
MFNKKIFPFFMYRKHIANNMQSGAGCWCPSPSLSRMSLSPPSWCMPPVVVISLSLPFVSLPLGCHCCSTHHPPHGQCIIVGHQTSVCQSLPCEQWLTAAGVVVDVWWWVGHWWWCCCCSSFIICCSSLSVCSLFIICHLPSVNHPLVSPYLSTL